MDLKLAQRTALITGGSKGIGLAVAERFAAEGCRVMLAARGADELERVSSQLAQRYGVQVGTVAADIATPAGRDEVLAQCAHVDILVNNAGAIPVGAIDEIDDQHWRTAWELKVFGYINLTRALFVRMKERGSGVIVNVIGAAGERLNANYIAGSTGNATLMAFTKALGSTSGDMGVRVLGVNPGPVATERHVAMQKQKARLQLGDESRWREFYQGLPMNRPATPDEIAATVVFLASDLSSYTTGTIVTVDGGYTNRGAR